MRIGIYARVSTTDKGQDIDLQLHELRRYAEARGWEAVEYVDEGVSGVKDSRPGLNNLMADARRRRIDGVLVWKLDRLGRSLSHLLKMLNEFQALGVAFVSLKEAIDMTTATGKLLVHIIGSFAEFERDLISERVRAGIANARAKGKIIGRKPTPKADRERIIRMSGEGVSIRGIAKKTKVSAATVHRILTAQG
jgi:putative DNA-invertase from lambdoid prophage Rac